MKKKMTGYAVVGFALMALLIALIFWQLVPDQARAARGNGYVAPKFVVHADWPKPLPNRWLVGQVAGVAVDSRDHIWIIQRPSTLTDDEKGASLTPPRSECCLPAPSVMECDTDGNLIRAWGGQRIPAS